MYFHFRSMYICVDRASTYSSYISLISARAQKSCGEIVDNRSEKRNSDLIVTCFLVFDDFFE